LRSVSHFAAQADLNAWYTLTQAHQRKLSQRSTMAEHHSMTSMAASEVIDQDAMSVTAQMGNELY